MTHAPIRDLGVAIWRIPTGGALLSRGAWSGRQERRWGLWGSSRAGGAMLLARPGPAPGDGEGGP